VFLLSKIGKVTVWEENRENSFIPCILSLSRSPPLLTDMALFRCNQSQELLRKKSVFADPISHEAKLAHNKEGKE
jgi:hypothetical protein